MLQENNCIYFEQIFSFQPENRMRNHLTITVDHTQYCTQAYENYYFNRSCKICTHLSKAGVRKLLTNLSLKLHEPYQNTKGHQIFAKQRKQSTKPNSNTSQSHHTACQRCGESNHVTQKCRHLKPVSCRVCGQLGHKSKHHLNH